jgi:hypothetical protein
MSYSACQIGSTASYWFAAPVRNAPSTASTLSVLSDGGRRAEHARRCEERDSLHWGTDGRAASAVRAALAARSAVVERCNGLCSKSYIECAIT